MIPNATQAFRQRLVLDTNVCLDLFMFRDPRWQALHETLQSGVSQAVTRADCRKEFELVLAYKKMNLTPASQAAILAEYDRWFTLLEPSASAALAALPRCKDGDDQKFLELALASGADVLITKDKALLKLARKTIRSGLFRIFTPEGWLASFVPNQDLSK